MKNDAEQLGLELSGSAADIVDEAPASNVISFAEAKKVHDEEQRKAAIRRILARSESSRE